MARQQERYANRVTLPQIPSGIEPGLAAYLRDLHRALDRAFGQLVPMLTPAGKVKLERVLNGDVDQLLEEYGDGTDAGS